MADSKNLLVISYHFPPEQTVGGLRWAGLSKYLARRGWKVHVLTAAEGVDAVASGESVQVHVCRPHPTMNDGYNALAARWRRSRSGDDGSAELLQSPTRPNSNHGRLSAAIRGARKEISEAISLPDGGRGWILPAGLKARSLIRSQGIDAVVSSGPPHSAHLAALVATFGRSQPLTIDMRDPWAGLDTRVWRFAESRIARWTTPRLERLAFARARRVIANTAEFADALQRAEPRLEVESVPNGIDLEQLPEPARPPAEGLTVVHIGTLYGGRDLGPILTAMKELFARAPDSRALSRLVVAGSVNTERARRFMQQVVDADLEDVVKFRGVIPRPEALELLRRAHLALVLAQDQPMQVPAKLFESIGLEVPTLVITESGSATAREGRRLGAFVHAPEDTAGMRDVLQRVWEADGLRIPPQAPIGYDHLAARMEAVLLDQARPRDEQGQTSHESTEAA